MQGENIAVGEAQQIAKFADKVSRKGSKLFLRLKGGKVVSRESTLEDREGESSDGDNYGLRYVFYDFINPWYVVGVHLYEGGVTQFINRGTGAVATVDGYPQFSPNKTRFVAIGYPGASPSGAEIWRMSRKDIVRERDLGDTALYVLRWSGPSTVEVVAQDEVVARFTRHGTSWTCSGSSSICNTEGVIKPSNRVAEVHATDKEGWTALERASAAGDIEAVRRLLKGDADVNARDEKGGTALIYAVRGGQLGVVKLLPKMGADVNAKDNHGWTALMEAAKRGHLDVVKLLLDEGADVNAKDNHGWTVLMEAATNGRLDVVKPLLERGSDVNAKDNYGWTALKIAEEDGHKEIVELLKAHRAK